MSQRTTFSRTWTEEMQHHPLVSTYPCPRAPHGELSRHCKDFSRAERTRLLLPRLAAWIMRLVMFSLNSTTCSLTLAEPFESCRSSLLLAKRTFRISAEVACLWTQTVWTNTLGETQTEILSQWRSLISSPSFIHLKRSACHQCTYCYAWLDCFDWKIP